MRDVKIDQNAQRRNTGVCKVFCRRPVLLYGKILQTTVFKVIVFVCGVQTKGVFGNHRFHGNFLSIFIPKKLKVEDLFVLFEKLAKKIGLKKVEFQRCRSNISICGLWSRITSFCRCKVLRRGPQVSLP